MLLILKEVGKRTQKELEDGQEGVEMMEIQNSGMKFSKS